MEVRDGEVILQGRDILRASPDELRSIRGAKIGFIFQSFNLVSSMTALDNVSFPMRFAGIGGRARKQVRLTPAGRAVTGRALTLPAGIW